MENVLNLSIVTPNGQIFNNKVTMVTLPGADGEFGVMPGHADTLSLLKTGVIELKKENGEIEYVAIDWGYTKVSEGSVDVLIDDAVLIDGVSEGEIANAVAKAKDLVEKASDNTIAIGSVISRIDQAGKNAL
ncbi:MAG: ATP synthase F1 subunit epsilon [Campylobacterales bacterium]